MYTRVSSTISGAVVGSWSLKKRGIVTHTGGGCLLLVRNGGRVGENVAAGAIVFHESDATVPRMGAGLIDVGKFVFSPHPVKLDVE